MSSPAGDIVPITTVAATDINLRTLAKTAIVGVGGGGGDRVWPQGATSILFAQDCAQFDCVLAESGGAVRSFTGANAKKAGQTFAARILEIKGTTTAGVAMQIAYGETDAPGV